MFCVKQLQFLGYQIDKNRITPLPGKVEVVQNFQHVDLQDLLTIIVASFQIVQIFCLH